jgi:hypothetical protein
VCPHLGERIVIAIDNGVDTPRDLHYQPRGDRHPDPSLRVLGGTPARTLNDCSPLVAAWPLTQLSRTVAALAGAELEAVTTDFP